MQIDSMYAVGAGDTGDQAFGYLQYVRLPGQVWKHHDELVASHAGDRIAWTHLLDHSTRHLD